jgi:multidrug resistance efflux pump
VCARRHFLKYEEEINLDNVVTPMPGVVVSVSVNPGDPVVAGQTIAVGPPSHRLCVCARGGESNYHTIGSGRSQELRRVRLTRVALMLSADC